MDTSPTPQQQSGQDFKIDIAALRAKARQNLECGVITETYTADRDKVIELLNEALATELVCVLRYKRHYFVASGIHSDAVTSEFAEHATQEQDHADRLAARIIELGGEPDFNPDHLTRKSHSEYIEGANLRDMIKENLVAERIAIDSYKMMIEYIGDNDPTTRRLLEEILAVEEEHAHDMLDLLERE